MIRSPWQMAARRFARNRSALAGLIVLAGLMAVCFGAIPWATATVQPEGAGSLNAAAGVPRYQDQRLMHVKEAPQWAGFWGVGGYWMGTDSLGRDLRPRFLLGGAISLSIGLASALIAVAIGTGAGLLAGYVGGRTDAILMRGVDVLYGLPYILLVILMRVALVPWVEGVLTATWPGTQASGHGILNERSAGMWANYLVLLVGIGAVSWLTLARVVRGQVMTLREQPFIEAARAMGLSWWRIMLRHILPNLIGTVIVYGTLTVPAAILSESFLSFLGLGIQAPVPSWGNMASDGMAALNPVSVRWWLIFWPCAGLSVALLALNFVGDGIREAVDVKG